MSEAAVGGERGKIDIGRVLQQTFGVIGRNFPVFALLGLVLAAIPLAIVSYLQASLLRGVDLTNPTFVFTPGYLTNAGLGGLAALITSAILQGALIYATVQDLNGQRAGLGDSLATGLRNFLPLIIVSILWAIGVVFGFILLIVPGIILLCIWCVAIPSLIADRTGIFGAFSRSAELTRGNRWRIFALGVILWVLMIVVGTVFNAMSGVYGIPAGDVNTALARVTNPVFVVLNVIQSVITSVIGSALVAVLYVELRRAREGVGPEWLADIFS
jgi:hypothetical protein